MSRVTYLLAALFLTLSLASVQAADSVYLICAKVKGAETAAGIPEGAVKLMSIGFNVSRVVASAAGRASTRESSMPAVSELSVELENAIASLDFFKLSLTGGPEPVRLEFYKSSPDGKLQKYQTIYLENTLVTKFELNKNQDDPQRILIGLNFTKIKLEQAAQGGAKPASYEWDAATGKGG